MGVSPLLQRVSKIVDIGGFLLRPHRRPASLRPAVPSQSGTHNTGAGAEKRRCHRATKIPCPPPGTSARLCNRSKGDNSSIAGKYTIYKEGTINKKPRLDLAPALRPGTRTTSTLTRCRDARGRVLAGAGHPAWARQQGSAPGLP